MKYRWLEQKTTCEELSQKLGRKVLSITRGLIVTKEEEKGIEGSEITEMGIEIEFEHELTDDELAELDINLTPLQRENGKALAQRVDGLKSRVTNLEKRER